MISAGRAIVSKIAICVSQYTGGGSQHTLNAPLRHTRVWLLGFGPTPCSVFQRVQRRRRRRLWWWWWWCSFTSMMQLASIPGGGFVLMAIFGIGRLRFKTPCRLIFFLRPSYLANCQRLSDARSVTSKIQ